MSLEKITENDLLGKGVMGQPDVPGLTAAQMQAKVEEIVREVAIAKINEVIDYIFENVASKEELEHLIIETGAVTSVFGRAGDIFAREGDYTAEMVGAAKALHAEQHKPGGTDPLLPEDFGAAEESHGHGNLTDDGKIGSINGMMVVTGVGGLLEAKNKSSLGFAFAPETLEITGAFSALDNKEYIGTGITDFNFTCDEAKIASCHGWVTFGSSAGNVTLTGFDFIDDADEMQSSAPANSKWEFDLDRGCLIIRKRSE